MAKPNYQYERRQRDIAKKKKQDEKRQRKLERKQGETGDEAGTAAPDAESGSENAEG